MKQLIILILMLPGMLALNATVRVLEEHENTLIVEYVLDKYEVLDEGNYSKIMLEDANYPITIGAPSLPSTEFKVATPPYGSAICTVLSSTQKDITLAKRISPVPTIISSNGVSDYKLEIDESLYTVPAKDLVEAMPKELFRGHPFIPFVINPVAYDGQNGISLTTSALIRIELSGDTANKSLPSNDPLLQYLMTQVINPQSARYWREQARNQVNFADFSHSPWWMRVETDKKGMYRINPSQLNGFAVSEIDPRSFRMFTSTGKPIPYIAQSPGNEFKEVPIMVVGEEDGSFDSGDYIVFYGSNRTGWEHNNPIQMENNILYHNPYSNNNVYWLSYAGDFAGEPLRIPSGLIPTSWDMEQNYHLETVHLETESHRREQTGLVWYMTRMFGSSTLEYSFNIDLPQLVNSADNLLSFRIRQEDVNSGMTHSIQVYVNDQSINNQQGTPRTFNWTGNGSYEFSEETTLLHAGNNRIRIKVLRNSGDNLFLDYIRVTYKKALTKEGSQYSVNAANASQVRYTFSGNMSNTRVYQVDSDYEISTLPPLESSNNFYFVADAGSSAQTRYYVCRPEELYTPALMLRVEPTNLADVNNSVQSVIVCPPDFVEQAEELAQMYQENWSLNTKVVLQDDIMDQFNGGHPDPAAIRQYVRWLFHNAPEPKIQSLTLLGLGSLDWRNYSQNATRQNQIMIYQHPNTSPANVSDDYFAMITTNTYPEIAVGRYPVSSANELDIMLNNFRRYTQSPKPGDWRNSMLFLADDFVNGDATNDFQHTEDMQDLTETLNPSVYQAKIFAEEWEYDQFLNKPRVRDEMFKQINQGKFLWYYVGHGSFDVLGMQNYFTGATDMVRFQNPDMLPIFIAAACEVSSFDHWAYESLGQKTVLLDNRGAIASVGATRKSFPDPNHGLMVNFVGNMVNFRNPVGYSLINAKLRYTQSTTNDEMYILFGDPNLRITPPQRDSTMSIVVGEDPAETLAHSRDTVHLEGGFSQAGLNGEANLKAFDASRHYSVRTFPVSQSGSQIFNGVLSVQNSEYAGGLVVPDDITGGDDGLITAYLWDEASKQDYISYYYPLALSDEVQADAPANDGPPQISLYLGSYDFRDGDTVSTSPTLYAKIVDENGINVTGSPGHNILLVIDNSIQPISITQYFSHDADSYSSGTLVYPLKDISEGMHTLQVIAFDSYNLPAVQTTNFVAKASSAISIEDLLIYPNPIKKDGHITFIISESAALTVDIFTMSGRRIRRIESNVNAGFQQIPFDGKDEFGHRLANNTYFIRVRAKNAEGKTVEKRERMVIYK